MCVLCDGANRDDLMVMTHERVTAHGFTMFAVEGSTPWTYTVGLVDSYDHPELVVTGVDADSSMRLLSALAADIRSGRRFEPSGDRSDAAHPRDRFLRFGPVHHAQWERGRFNMWVDYYGWLGRLPSPSALQVLWLDEDGVLPPDRVQPRLDRDPGHDVNGLNRAQRRRHARRR